MPSRTYPVWLAFTIPVVLVATGVFIYRASALSDLETGILHAAKQSLDEFAKGHGEPSALAKAVGRADTASVDELKIGFAREIKSRGALAGVRVDEVDVEVSNDGDVHVEIYYRARVAGIPSSHALSIADSFPPIRPEPAAARTTDLTAGVNLPYASPTVSGSRPSPSASRWPSAPQFYRPPGAVSPTSPFRAQHPAAPVAPTLSR